MFAFHIGCVFVERHKYIESKSKNVWIFVNRNHDAVVLCLLCVSLRFSFFSHTLTVCPYLLILVAISWLYWFYQFVPVFLTTSDRREICLLELPLSLGFHDFMMGIYQSVFIARLRILKFNLHSISKHCLRTLTHSLLKKNE